MEFVIVTGISGAGKSRVAAVLEDMDFYCVDNMPVEMMPRFAEICLAAQGRYEKVAMVIDVRALEDVDDLFRVFDEMKTLGCTLNILFIEAGVDTILRRYKETRRRHPLDESGTNVQDALLREMEFLAPIRDSADDVIDTTNLNLSKLERRLTTKFQASDGDSKSLNVTVKSFGFKYGLPVEADMMFDIRFIPNPFYIQELRDKSGLDEVVKKYVFGFEQSNDFFRKLCDMLDFLLPNFIEEGRRYFAICLGCTGGRHRSTAMAEALTEHLRENGYPVDCIHRDIEKDQSK